MPSPHPAPRTGLRGLWGWMRPYWARLLLVLAGLTMTSAAMLALGPGLGALVDAGLRDGGRVVTPASLGVLGLLALSMVAGTWLRYYNISWVGERVAADIRRAVFDHLAGLDVAFFDSREGADLQSRFTSDTAMLQVAIGTSLSMATRNLAICLGSVALLFFYHPGMAGIALACLACCAPPLIWMGRQVKQLSRQTQAKVSDVGAEIQDMVANIKVVHAFNRQGLHRERFAGAVEQAFAAGASMVLRRAVLISLVIATTMLGLVLLVWHGMGQVAAEVLSPGDLVSFLFLALLAGGSAGILGEVGADLARALGAGDRLASLLRARSVVQARQLAGGLRAREQPRPQPPAAYEGPPSLRLRNLRFRYPSRPGVEVLQGLNMDVAAGSYVALVGHSGAGKSTLFDLLLRLYEADGGSIELNGADIRALEVERLRRTLGLVRQDSPLLRGTIRDNILYGFPQATEEDVQRACRDAWADVFIRELPDGMHTAVGDAGKVLSGGQRQRLAIARTLLANPRVLLLDEATSHLDAESASMVRQALLGLRGRCTLVVIAHMLSTVRDADRIYFMQAGRIAAEGTHEELVRSSRDYRNLVRLQLEGGEGAAAESGIQEGAAEEAGVGAAGFHPQNSPTHASERRRTASLAEQET